MHFMTFKKLKFEVNNQGMDKYTVDVRIDKLDA